MDSPPTTFEVLTAHGEDAKKWDQITSGLLYDQRDISATSAYGRSQEKPGETARLAVLWDMENGGGLTVQPFMLREIADTGLRDMTMPGYGGPLTVVSLPSAETGEIFAKHLGDWQRVNNVVAEFYMVNPVFAADQWALLPAKPVYEKHVAILPTGDEGQPLRMRESRAHAIKKAQENPDTVLEVSTGADAHQFAAAFHRLYSASMDHKGASQRWRVSMDTIVNTFAMLGDQAVMMWATVPLPSLQQEADAAAIFLFGHACSYYSLAATSELKAQGLADILIMQARHMAHTRGCAWLHLGGGVSNKWDDGLFQYKRSFGGLLRPVYSVRRVVNWQQYIGLCERMKLPTESSFFPAYRALEAVEAGEA